MDMKYRCYLFFHIHVGGEGKEWVGYKMEVIIKKGGR